MDEQGRSGAVAIAADAGSVTLTFTAMGTLTVGARNGPPTVAAALQRAADGDTIEVPSGQYRGDVAVILQRRLRIVGIGTLTNAP